MTEPPAAPALLLLVTEIGVVTGVEPVLLALLVLLVVMAVAPGVQFS
jgi:hypothetical protein